MQLYMKKSQWLWSKIPIFTTTLVFIMAVSDRGPLKSIFMFLMYFFPSNVLAIVFISQLRETLGTVLFLFYSVKNNETRDFNNYSLSMSAKD